MIPPSESEKTISPDAGSWNGDEDTRLAIRTEPSTQDSASTLVSAVSLSADRNYLASVGTDRCPES
jgi:hypothetical protein